MIQRHFLVYLIFRIFRIEIILWIFYNLIRQSSFDNQAISMRIHLHFYTSHWLWHRLILSKLSTSNKQRHSYVAYEFAKVLYTGINNITCIHHSFLAGSMIFPILSARIIFHRKLDLIRVTLCNAISEQNSHRRAGARGRWDSVGIYYP